MAIFRIGVMPEAQIRARAVAIARGDLKLRPQEPKVWAPSLAAIASILTPERMALLRTIRKTKPSSTRKLALITGNTPRRLASDLRKLADIGLIELRQNGSVVRPIAKASQIQIALRITEEPAPPLHVTRVRRRANRD